MPGLLRMSILVLIALISVPLFVTASEKVRKNTISRPSRLNLYLVLDCRDKSPVINLTVNPAKDIRVREAITRPINVQAIKGVIMNGMPTPFDRYAPALSI